VNQDSALPGASTTTGDVETEIISSKQLYQTFMKLVEGNTINFITQGNRQQLQALNNPGYNKSGGAAANDDDFN